MGTTGKPRISATFMQGVLVGGVVGAASFWGGQQWSARQPFTPVFWSGVHEERPAQRAARLLEQTTYNLEAMFHRELTAADTPLLLNGLVSAVDPHGGYIAPEYARALNGEADTAAPYRVGVLGTPLSDRFVVETTAPGGPADRAGLRPGDRIFAIDNEDMTDSPGQVVFDALLAVVDKGAGAPIHIKVLRGAQTLDLEMVPERLPPFFAFDLGQKEGVAHIAITAFYPGVATAIRGLVAQAQSDGAQGVVLDLRGNAGGRVDETLDVLGLFLPKGSLAYVRDARGQAAEEGRTRSDPVFEGVRVAVLIDGDSASASEILAAALQAHHAGLVVGERSYGKGSIQTVYPLDAAGGAIKMTIGFYRDPLGRPIDGIGVEPDVEARVEKGGPRPAYGQPDAGFTAAAAWVRSGDAIPQVAHNRPQLRLPSGGPQ